jgi:hypothetical protein
MFRLRSRMIPTKKREKMILKARICRGEMKDSSFQ